MVFHVSQKKYVEDLLSLAHLTDTKVVDTPLELNTKLSKDDGHPLLDPTLYRHLFRTHIYLTMTRHIWPHAVHVAS